MCSKSSLARQKQPSADTCCGTVTKLVHVSGTCHTLECALRVHERMSDDRGGHRPVCVCVCVLLCGGEVSQPLPTVLLPRGNVGLAE